MIAPSVDHAGYYETISQLMVFCPESIDINHLSEVKHWFTESAKNANLELGKKMLKASVDYLVERIK